MKENGIKPLFVSALAFIWHNGYCNPSLAEAYANQSRWETLN